MPENRPFFLIMCGGNGKRLASISNGLPKQFLMLPSGRTMIEETVLRINGLNGKIGLILGKEHLNQAEKLFGNFIEFYSPEPCSKNTAAAIGLACLRLAMSGQEETIAVFMPCDHRIDDQDKFNQSMRRAIDLAKQNNLVLIGCKFEKLDSQLGYIIGKDGHEIDYFVEKPLEKHLEELIKKGCWVNSGIFVGRVKTFIQNFEKLCPSLFLGLKNFLKNGSGFHDLPDISFDKAIIQAGAACFLVKGEFEFLDLGKVESFLSLKNMT